MVRIYLKLYSSITLLFFFAGCAAHGLRFADAEPVMFFNDIHPIPSPNSIQYQRFDYFASSLPALPELKPQAIAETKSALDVNSMDEVPASSWYIPRLGYQQISPEELVMGPTEFGPPEPPVQIIRIRKKESTPRFFVKDRRNIFYLLKFDPLNYPGIATTTSIIVNRLFWGFGYHVPEDHSICFKKEDFIPAPESGLTPQALDEVLKRVARTEKGLYRTISSRIIDGYPLGPTPEQGIRPDDPNDHFPHERRRVLRGLRVFCAFANMCDISSDNTLDMYVGEDDMGYIKHHIIDFDDAFGTHAARLDRLWAGYNHIFSMADMLKNLVSIGLIVEDWEQISETQWKSVGTFEADIFDPQDWKETHPYQPIRRSEPADDYWAAKKLAALTPAHISALVKEADYPEPEAEDYMIQTLNKRRAKCLDYFFSRVSPAEFVSYNKNILIIENLYSKFVGSSLWKSEFIVQFKTANGEQVAKQKHFTSDSVNVPILLPSNLFDRANNYLKVEITIKNRNQFNPEPAQFHFLKRTDNTIKLVGIVH